MAGPERGVGGGPGGGGGGGVRRGNHGMSGKSTGLTFF